MKFWHTFIQAWPDKKKREQWLQLIGGLQGMPLFAEIGPLELDPHLREEADQIIHDVTQQAQPNFEQNDQPMKNENEERPPK